MFAALNSASQPWLQTARRYRAWILVGLTILFVVIVRVRLREMRQSVRILEQAIVQIPAKGPTWADVPQFFRPPAGEAYGHIEAPKGNLGFYVVSDGSIAPYRVHIFPPSLINVTALADMAIGWKVADLIIIFGSIDVVLGEIDR